MATYYKHNAGQFHLFDDVAKEDGSVEENKHIHSSDQVAIAWARIESQNNRIHVFTHGTLAGMQEWVKAHNAHSEHQASLKVFDQNTPVATINKAISDPEFFSTLL